MSLALADEDWEIDDALADALVARAERETRERRRASASARTRKDGIACALALRAPGDRFACVPLGLDASDVVGDAVRACGGWWEESRGEWCVRADARRAVEEALARAGARVVAAPAMVARAVDVRFDAEEARARAVYEERVPRELDAKMFDFQREGVMYALRRGGRALIGDEMGLGKTVQACALLACYREEWPALILVPTSLREAWRGALQSWLDVDDGDIACVGAASEAGKLDEGRAFNIVPYSLCVKLKDKLTQKRFKCIVADESHYLKDRRAQRTQAVLPLMKEGATRVICLTGTPALSRPIELFTQLEALVPRVFFRLHEYGARYCAGGAPFGMYTGCSHADELHIMISRLCMIRRLKKDVLASLPPKRRSQVFLSVESSAMGGVRRIRAQLDKLRQDGGSEFEEKRLLNELFLESAKAKVASVCDYLETLIEGSTSKFLFFAHHAVLLDGVSDFLKKKKCKSIRIDGSTPATARGDLVNTFQRDDDVRVAVLSIKAAGMGLTLTAASTVVFGEMVWTPGDLIQAEDRAHRIGQASSVLVQYLHARDTIDEIVWQTIRKKLDTLGAVLNGQTSGNNLEATTEGLGRRSSGGSGGEKSSASKKQKTVVVDVTQRTLVEMFASQQATQRSFPAGDDETDDDENDDAIFAELASKIEKDREGVVKL